MMHDAFHLIFQVVDQARSTRFYEAALLMAPRLKVPGMTEFVLPGGATWTNARVAQA